MDYITTARNANSTSVGKLTINGKNVLIEYNEAKTSHGGGIFAGSGSTVTLKNGKNVKRTTTIIQTYTNISCASLFH